MEDIYTRIECKYGALACYDNIAIDNIYSVDIDTVDKTIDFNGIDGFTLAWITQYDEETVEEVEIIKYNENGELDGNNEEITIIKNGKLVIK